MRPTEEYLQKRLETCRRLFFQYEGREHSRIEREMRSLGFVDFNRRCLYPRGIRSGWIERYGWDRELLSKEPAADNSRESINEFHEWIKRVSPPMFHWDAPHLKLLIKTLQLVTEGKIKRLMIFMPPRHGKSELVTTRYTAWRLMKNPGLKVILASYAQGLANRFSRAVRNTLAEHFSQIRQTQAGLAADHADNADQNGLANISGSASSARSAAKIRSDSPDSLDSQDSRLSNPFRPQIINSAAEWETGKGGGVKAVGVGGGITGYGAGLMMIDDPIKSREQAESQSYRDKVWQWFNDDMLTRLDPDAPCILIQTRWHEDDLAGRILKQQQEDGTNEWHVISLPAIAEETEPRSEPGAIATGSNDATKNEHEKTKESSRRDADPQSGVSSPTVREGADRMENEKSDEENAKDEAFLIRQIDVLNTQLNKPPVYIEYENGRRERFHPIGGLKPKYMRERINELEDDLHRLRQRIRARKETSGKDARSSANVPDLLDSPEFQDWRRPGQALWPERFDVETLEKTRKRMGTYSFAALYQQKPVPTEGGLFKRAWFTNNIVQVPPPNLDWKRGYDLAFNANPDSDHSATLKVAYDKDGVLYIDGCFREKLNYPLQRRLLMHYIETETRTEHGVELSANGHAILQDLRHMPKLYGRKFRGVKVETNKLTRALPWIALAEEGRVRLVAGRWNEEFINEACSFPHGHHDDQIDAVSIAVRMHGEKKGKRFWTF